MSLGTFRGPTSEFPNPRESSPEGLVAVGGHMNAETLMAAYAKGIFPWPQEGVPWLWFSPDPRGVLDFADLHLSKSLKKLQRHSTDVWRVSVNEAFEHVMRECQMKPRPGQPGTWIMPEMIPAYGQLFNEGHALSVECWRGEQLVGGIYGVLSEQYFSAESMFYHETGASKVALLHLIGELKRREHAWMDMQMVTSVVEALGGKYIPREEFLKRIGV